MLKYNTTFNPRPPSAGPMRMESPYSQYNQNHRDILSGLADSAAADYGVAASKASSEFDAKRREAQNQLVLQGLQQMAEAQQNSNTLANTRMQNVSGFASDLLRGLFS